MSWLHHQSTFHEQIKGVGEKKLHVPCLPFLSRKKTSDGSNIPLRILTFSLTLCTAATPYIMCMTKSYEEGWVEDRFNMNLSSYTRKKWCRRNTLILQIFKTPMHVHSYSRDKQCLLLLCPWHQYHTTDFVMDNGVWGGGGKNKQPWEATNHHSPVMTTDYSDLLLLNVPREATAHGLHCTRGFLNSYALKC